MFKRFLKKQGLLSLILAIPFLGMTLGFVPMLGVSKQSQQVVVEDQKQLGTIASLMVERMELSKDLAIYKWNHTLPIDELESEKAFLAQLLEKATSSNLDPKFVQSFFRAQIEASKMINIENFENWVNTNIHKHEYSPNSAVLQKKIQEIDEKLFVTLKDVYVVLSGSQKETFKVELVKMLQDKGFSRDVIDSATHF